MSEVPSSHDQLQVWLISNYGAEKFRPGLDRVRGFVQNELTQITKLSPRIITVAGTNGKGETCMTLARLAQEDGEAFVMWTSPHLLRVTERFQSEEGEISVTELSRILNEVRRDAQQSSVGLSYYEILFCAFLRWAILRNPKTWIMEVGLGGRLDAVNLLDASYVGLTSISRDHQEFLGTTYSSILMEKLGVLRKETKFFSTLETKYLRSKTQEYCQKMEVQWTDLFETSQLSLKSTFSERNRALASELWGRPVASQKLASFGPMPGRGEKWHFKGHEFIFYGSHNPDGMRKLVQLLARGFYTKPQENIHQIWAAFSHRSPQDLKAMMQILGALVSEKRQVYLTQFNHPKAMPLDDWWKQDEGSPVRTIHEWTELLTDLSSTPTCILVTGSYYFVATVQSHLLSMGGHSVPGR